MLRSIIARRWIVSLLVLVFCAGLSMPAFAGSSGHGHDAASEHGTCFHAGESTLQDDPDGSTGAMSAADCALAHLGQALLGRAAPLPMRVRSCAYPPVRLNHGVNRVPTPEMDPPRAMRIV